MQTKWNILEQRLGNAIVALQDARAAMDGLESTPCGLTCSGCGILLPTEADFAKHFVVPDSRYLNLGECPDRQPRTS